ncbi:MAG: hypothetical protein KGL39_27185, partial [Patescibacteria group bacterium]|nr:hypothetical protein [Patescibacteria group bacterium]
MNNRKRFTLSALFECIVIIALLSLFAFQSMAQTVNITNAVSGYTVATTNPPKFTLIGLFNGSSGVQHVLGDAVSYIEQTPTP